MTTDAWWSRDTNGATAGASGRCLQGQTGPLTRSEGCLFRCVRAFRASRGDEDRGRETLMRILVPRIPARNSKSSFEGYCGLRFGEVSADHPRPARTHGLLFKSPKHSKRTGISPARLLLLPSRLS